MHKFHFIVQINLKEQIKLDVIKAKKYATDKEIEATNAKVKAMVAECVEYGNNSLFPGGEELWQGVYSEEGYPFIKE